MDIFQRSNKSPEVDERPPQPYTNIERLKKISEILDIDTEFTPEYLKHKNIANRFAFLGERVNQYILLSTTEYNPQSDVFSRPKVFVCQLKTRARKIENIQLGIEFGLEQDAVEFIDVLWFANAVNQEGMDDDSYNSLHALDPLHIIRSDCLAAKKKAGVDPDQIKRNLNYIAQVLDIYERAFSVEHSGDNRYEGVWTPRSNRSREDRISKAVKILLSRLVD